MAYKRVLLPVGLDKNGNPIAKQIGGKSEAERFMSGLQAAIASGRIRELLPPEYFQSSEQFNAEENTKQLHPFTAYAHMFYERYKRHLRSGTNVTQEAGSSSNASSSVMNRSRASPSAVFRTT